VYFVAALRGYLDLRETKTWKNEQNQIMRSYVICTLHTRVHPKVSGLS
jgi:hypothetical protein